MSGAIAKRVNESGKALGGKLSYAWSTVAVFARWRNAQVTVSVDGEERSGAMYDVIVANGRYLGGGMKICPDAEPADGLFDVLLIGDISKRDLVMTLPKIYRGTHLPHPRAELLRGARVSIDAPIALPVQLDGEQPGTTPATFDVVPGALRLRVPGRLARAGRRGVLLCGRRARRSGALGRRPLARRRLALELVERASRST